MLPVARTDGLLVQEVGDELVIYDGERHKGHALNRTAALIWRHCDGKSSISDMAASLAKQLGIPADEELVWLALDRLEKAHLLREPLIRPEVMASISRRQMIQKLGQVGGLSLLLPVVTSILAPTPAMAITPAPARCPGNIFQVASASGANIAAATAAAHARANTLARAVCPAGCAFALVALDPNPICNPDPQVPGLMICIVGDQFSCV